MIIRKFKSERGSCIYVCKCDKCNKEFNRYYRFIKRSKTGKHFCSMECAKTLAGKNFLGKKHTEESKIKMRKSHKGAIPWSKGKHHSEETKRKISEANRGKKSASWKGGRRKSTQGYVWLYLDYNPISNKCYILEHRYIMEQYLGRALYPWEIVHHKNGIKDDNRLENLKLLPGNEHNTKVQEVFKENIRLKNILKEANIKY